MESFCENFSSFHLLLQALDQFLASSFLANRLLLCTGAISLFLSQFYTVCSTHVCRIDTKIAQAKEIRGIKLYGKLNT